MTYYFPNLPIHTLTLLGGVATTSYIFFAHIGLSQAGVIPLIKGELGKTSLTTQQKVEAWTLFFNPTAKWTVGSTLLASILNLSTAYLTTSNPIRTLTLTAGILGPLIIPYTMTLIMPINTALFDLSNLSNGSSSSTNNNNDNNTTTLSETQEEEAERLIGEWDRRHKGRFVMYAGAWALGLWALVLDGFEAGRF